MSEDQLIENITNYFRVNIFENYQKNVLKEQTRLKSYNINPIIVKYLSKVLEDDFTPLGMAKALYYPRVLGTSITTSFGTRLQKMFIDLELADPSLISGMDIEIIDHLDGRKKWCQLKSGPNTINSGDVQPLIRKFSKVANLARTNSMVLNNSDLILGVLYGDENQLSQHYRRIDETYPVIIGKEFWHRLTGFPEFYPKLVINLDLMIQNINTEDYFRRGYLELAKEIEDSTLFNFS